MSNTFGERFRITSFGESHGDGIGVVVDGVPAGIEISEEEVQVELDRRRSSGIVGGTTRNERDLIKIYSGVFEGKTTGAPVMIMVQNEDARSVDYGDLKNLFRPGHADFTYQSKYGIRDYRGGGRASARVTLGWVAGGVIAKKFLKKKFGVEILSYVDSVGDVSANVSMDELTSDAIEVSAVRCPGLDASKKMEELILAVSEEGDSVGGVVKTVVKNLPVGFGEPVFDKLSANLAKAMFSINAVKGFEIGRGFESAKLRGSENNDEFFMDRDVVKTKTNNAGGILGGISTGDDLYFRTAFKPVSTIFKSQKTVNLEGKVVEFKGRGRHDSCVVPRAVAVVDAMTAIVLMNLVGD